MSSIKLFIFFAWQVPWPIYSLAVVFVVYKITRFKFSTATKATIGIAFLVSLALFFFEGDIFSFFGKSLTLALATSLVAHTINKWGTLRHPKLSASLSIGFVLLTIVFVGIVPHLFGCSCVSQPVIRENIFTGECNAYDGAGCCEGDGSPWFMKKGCGDDLQRTQLEKQNLPLLLLPL